MPVYRKRVRTWGEGLLIRRSTLVAANLCRNGPLACNARLSYQHDGVRGIA